MNKSLLEKMREVFVQQSRVCAKFEGSRLSCFYIGTCQVFTTQISFLSEVFSTPVRV